MSSAYVASSQVGVGLAAPLTFLPLDVLQN